MMHCQNKQKNISNAKVLDFLRFAECLQHHEILSDVEKEGVFEKEGLFGTLLNMHNSIVVQGQVKKGFMLNLAN